MLISLWGTTEARWGCVDFWCADGGVAQRVQIDPRDFLSGEIVGRDPGTTSVWMYRAADTGAMSAVIRDVNETFVIE
jgi:hypothetical protein